MIVSDAHQAAARRQKRKLRAREVSSENVLSAGQPRHDADAGRLSIPWSICRLHQEVAMCLVRCDVRGARASARRRKRASAPVRLGGRQIVERRDGDDAAEVRGIMSVRGAGCRSVLQLALGFFILADFVFSME